MPTEPRESPVIYDVEFIEWTPYIRSCQVEASSRAEAEQKAKSGDVLYEEATLYASHHYKNRPGKTLSIRKQKPQEPAHAE